MKKSKEPNLGKGLGLLHEPKLTSGKAAKALGISINTFKKYLAMGELPLPIKIGSQEFWLERDLEAWLMAQNPHLARKAKIAEDARKAVMKIVAMREAGTLGVAQ